MVYKANVLVLDDDENIISAFEDFFKRERCRMIAATSPAEALNKMKSLEIDLLITDIRLRHQSGVTFFLQLKSIGKHVPIIVITGYPESVEEKDLRALGASYLLVKPLELDRLREAVRDCLAQRRRT